MNTKEGLLLIAQVNTRSGDDMVKQKTTLETMDDFALLISTGRYMMIHFGCLHLTGLIVLGSSNVGSSLKYRRDRTMLENA